jgi:FAD/FMN-containing dehydrogenase
VVTEFEFTLHQVGSSALLVQLFYALEDGPSVLGNWRDLLARPTGLKDRYDPDNVFHRNHNIRPSR